MAEGAINKKGEAITSENVKNVIKERLKLDTRVTVLGTFRGFLLCYYEQMSFKIAMQFVFIPV